MKRKTQMILTAIRLVGTATKIYTVGKISYDAYKIAKKINGGAKVVTQTREKTNKILRSIRNIGAATEVVANATQIVSDVSKDTTQLKESIKGTSKSSEDKKETATKKGVSSKKKNR